MHGLHHDDWIATVHVMTGYTKMDVIVQIPMYVKSLY
jgi:hypothetical protein